MSARFLGVSPHHPTLYPTRTEGNPYAEVFEDGLLALPLARLRIGKMGSSPFSASQARSDSRCEYGSTANGRTPLSEAKNKRLSGRWGEDRKVLW